MTIIERLEEKVTRQESKVGSKRNRKTRCLQRTTGDSDVCDVQKASKH